MKSPTRGRMAGRPGARLSGEDGIALLMAIFLTATLAALAVSFSVSTQSHLHLTRYYKDGVQAYWTAQSGIQAANALLTLARQQQQLQGGAAGADGFNSPWNCESGFYQETVQGFLALPLCRSSYATPALLSALTDPFLAQQTPGTAQDQPPRSRCLIIDENSKLSLYGLVENLGSPTERTHADVYDRLALLLTYLVNDLDLLPPQARMERSLGGSLGNTDLGQPISLAQAQTLAGHLLDWIDSPNNTGDENPDLAEEACPEDGLPYSAKSGRLDSTEEIALVCGFRQMPRHLIEELGRHLTAYNLKTNVNTATMPVLCALIAHLNGTEDDCRKLHEQLHPLEAPDTPDDHLIQTENDYTNFLLNIGVDPALGPGLGRATGIRSDIFRVGVAGVVLDPESGSLEAESRIVIVLNPQVQGGLAYYRED